MLPKSMEVSDPAVESDIRSVIYYMSSLLASEEITGLLKQTSTNRVVTDKRVIKILLYIMRDREKGLSAGKTLGYEDLRRVKSGDIFYYRVRSRHVENSVMAFKLQCLSSTSRLWQA